MLTANIMSHLSSLHKAIALCFAATILHTPGLVVAVNPII